MKAAAVDLSGVSDPHEVIGRVVSKRLEEARSLAIALQHRGTQELHDFRIACKRLRYALERFETLDPSLEGAADQLSHLQDMLGEAHDRDVLLTMLPSEMPHTRERLERERATFIDRAAELWPKIEAAWSR